MPALPFPKESAAPRAPAKGKKQATAKVTNENAMLNPTPSFDKPKTRKRTLTLATGEEYDLDKQGSIPANGYIVEAMRLRIIQLEDELAATRPAKRAKTGKEEAPGPSSAPVAATSVVANAATSKADEKKRKAVLKKICDRLKKDCKSNDVKFGAAGSKIIKSEEVLEAELFHSIFTGKGTLLQPTPENKPTSTVYIMTFDEDEVLDVLGDQLKELKGNRWAQGFMFEKATKVAVIDVVIRSLNITYSTNMMKCSMKFEVAPEHESFY